MSITIFCFALMMATKRTSAIWNYFVDLGNNRAKCNVCSKQISFKGGSTFNLLRHLRATHPTISLPKSRLVPAHEENTDDPGEPSIAPTEGNSNIISSLAPPSTSSPTIPTPRRPQTQETITIYLHRPLSNRKKQEIDFSLVETIVKNYLPFQIVENPSFRKYSTLLNNSYKLLTRKTVTNVLLQQTCDITKGKINQALEASEAVTLTTDGWTSFSNESYLSVMAHYIGKDMEMKSSLLENFVYSEKHTAENLCNELKRVVREWRIENKVVAVVSDNVANIVAAIRLTGWRHVPCFAHTLNLFVDSGLTCIRDITMKVKRIVELFKRSPQASEKLRKTQQQLGEPVLNLKQDVITRWNFTYDMLENIVAVKNSLMSTIAMN
ncbi:zinc finger BED domain-containing protein 6-like [Periplaneta americana]|uniref:zinc finger BED domain-containing protein 6-like n=1 Tax=Periplaneta americana TaxID=6978 RepID=UPI0037E92B59